MKKEIKHIGIVGVTAEGAALTYKYICSESEKYLGKYQHPEVTLHTFSFSEHINFEGDRLERWSELIIESIRKLEKAGADFVICPSNTPHEVYERVVPHINVPWINIASEVQKDASVRNYKQVLLLGTSYTFESTVYPNAFRGSGIEIIKPSFEEQQQISEIINSELIKGRVTDSSKALICQILSKYENETDGVILGCTELPLIITDQSTSMGILDSTKILGEAAIRAAIS